VIDANFHPLSGSFKIGELASMIGLALREGDDASRLITDVSPLDSATKSDISFLDNVKYVDSFRKTQAGACVVRAKFADYAPKNTILLITEEPYYKFAQISQIFHPQPQPVPVIAPSASISSSAIIGVDVDIAENVVIGDGVKIGDGSSIGANTVISRAVQIGKNCRISNNVSISHAILGNSIIIHSGARIGQDGFGFAPYSEGLFKVPQLGRVIIEDGVEIGANSCIDRGAGPDTVIGSGTKIDNLVQIGHNVKIGRSCVVVSQVGISGSTYVGDGVMLGGQVGVAGHLRIGSGAKIAAQSGVITDVPAGAAFGGYPAVRVKDWHRQTIHLKKIIKRES